MCTGFPRTGQLVKPGGELSVRTGMVGWVWAQGSCPQNPPVHDDCIWNGESSLKGSWSKVHLMELEDYECGLLPRPMAMLIGCLRMGKLE